VDQACWRFCLALNEDLDAAWGVGQAKGPAPLPLVLNPRRWYPDRGQRRVESSPSAQRKKRGVVVPVILPEHGHSGRSLNGLGLLRRLRRQRGLMRWSTRLNPMRRSIANNNPCPAARPCEALRFFAWAISKPWWRRQQCRRPRCQCVGVHAGGQAFANSARSRRCMRLALSPIGGTFHIPRTGFQKFGARGGGGPPGAPHVLRLNGATRRQRLAEIASRCFPRTGRGGGKSGRTEALINAPLRAFRPKLRLPSVCATWIFHKSAIPKMAKMRWCTARLLVQ